MSKIDLSDLGYKQIPHYCTHAMESFAELTTFMPEKLGIPADLELLLCDLLRDSIKFILPDNGYLFDDHDYKPSMFDLLRLPYPICALEFTATPELYAEQSGLAQSGKRIALCFDPNALAPAQVARLTRLSGQNFLALVPERCIAVMAVFEVDGIWSVSVGVVLINLDEDRPMAVKGVPEEMSELADRVAARLKSVKTVTTHALPATFVPFPRRAAMVGQDLETAVESLCIDTIDEVRTTYEFLAAINCSNVGTVAVPAPKVLNDRRRKKGRPLFYPYKVLNLFAPATNGKGKGDGTHASPGAHLRRGHIRRLGERSDFKTLWINAMMVNARPGEPVSTVYKVKGAR